MVLRQFRLQYQSIRRSKLNYQNKRLLLVDRDRWQVKSRILFNYPLNKIEFIILLQNLLQNLDTSNYDDHSLGKTILSGMKKRKKPKLR